MLERALERVVTERSSHLFTLLGPAGVGKSRLVSEFLSGPATSATFLRGRCLSYGECITFFPLAEIVQEAWRCVAPGGRLVISDPFDYIDTGKRSDHIYELTDFLDTDEVMPDPYQSVIPFPLRVEWSQVVAVYQANLAIFEKRQP